MGVTGWKNLGIFAKEVIVLNAFTHFSMGLKLSVIKQDVDDDYVYSPVLVQFQYNQFYRKLTLQYHNILAKFKSQYYIKLLNNRKPCIGNILTIGWVYMVISTKMSPTCILKHRINDIRNHIQNQVIVTHRILISTMKISKLQTMSNPKINNFDTSNIFIN